MTEVHDVEDEESPPRKVLRDPGEPSKQELEEHRIDHIPYRSWCPYCGRGRGTGAQHRRVKEESSIPVFGFDYLHGAERRKTLCYSKSKTMLEVSLKFWTYEEPKFER